MIGDYFSSRSKTFTGMESRLNLHGTLFVLLSLFSFIGFGSFSLSCTH